MKKDYRLWQIIGASSVGTMIEWYDFYIFGSLATVISPLFYPKGNNTIALIAYLSTFAVGFVVRPFGALFFGRIGDLVGRKYAFLVTLLIMGGATALIGFLPTYATIGIAAPVFLLLIRVLQGLALGGEYGGAAVYVAEHVPDERRGFYTSFIQITATLGLFVSLVVILVVQNLMSKPAFDAWGWRLPFIIVDLPRRSFALHPSAHERVTDLSAHQEHGHDFGAAIERRFHTLGQPEARPYFIIRCDRRSGRGLVHGPVLCALLSADDSQSEHYFGQLHRGRRAVSRDAVLVLFGALSDRLGRKKIMMLGCILAAISYLPIYHAMQAVTGSNIVTAISQKNPVTGALTLTPQTSVGGVLQPAKEVLIFVNISGLLSSGVAWKLVLLVFVQVIFVTMVYGPIAAYLVEAFPAKIRYTSLSLPYHIGNGVFGGLLPLIGLSVIAQTGNIYAGLYYPIALRRQRLWSARCCCAKPNMC
jgi:MFS family permease